MYEQAACEKEHESKRTSIGTNEKANEQMSMQANELNEYVNERTTRDQRMNENVTSM